MTNGYIRNVDILTGVNFSSIKVANMELFIGQFVLPVGRGREWGNGSEGGNVILASCELHFIRVRENLVQHPNSNISIWIIIILFPQSFINTISHSLT